MDKDITPVVPHGNAYSDKTNGNIHDPVAKDLISNSPGPSDPQPEAAAYHGSEHDGDGATGPGGSGKVRIAAS